MGTHRPHLRGVFETGFLILPETSTSIVRGPWAAWVASIYAGLSVVVSNTDITITQHIDVCQVQILPVGSTYLVFATKCGNLAQHVVARFLYGFSERINIWCLKKRRVGLCSCLMEAQIAVMVGRSRLSQDTQAADCHPRIAWGTSHQLVCCRAWRGRTFLDGR